MIERGTDPALAATAREHLLRLDEVRRLDEHLDALVEAGRLDEVRDFQSDGGPWDGACGRLRAAEDAVMRALRARGLAGCVVDGHLVADLCGALPDESGDGRMVDVFALARIVALDD